MTSPAVSHRTRLLLVIAATWLLSIPASLAAQTGTRTDGDPASRSVEAPEKVTALDIFFACRHAEAFDLEQALGRFCNLRLPSRGDGQAIVARWVAGVDGITPELIRDRRRSVLEAQQRRRAAASAAGERSHDLAEREIVFGDGEHGIPGDVLAILPLVSGRINSFGEGLAVQQVQVVGYRTTGVTRQAALERADSVKARLDERLRELGSAIEVVTRDSAGNDPADRGRVSIHVVLPVLPAGTFRSLRSVPFGPGSAEMNAGARLQVMSAAGEILANSDYRNGALVEVVAYEDPKNSAIGIARRDAIVAALVGEGVVRDQIRAHVLPPRMESEQAGGGAPQLGGVLSLRDHGGSGSRLAGDERSLSSDFSLGWEAVAQAAADALVDRAARELQQYVLVAFGSQLCTDERKQTFVETCTLMLEPKLYAPSLETLRGVLRSDAVSLPERAMNRLLSRHFDVRAERAALTSLQQALSSVPPASAVPADVERHRKEIDSLTNESTAAREALEGRITRLGPSAERAVLALYALHFARRVQRGEHPAEVLIGFPAWRKEFAGPASGLDYVASRPSVERMERLARFVGAARDAAEDLRALSGGSIAADTIYRYAALQLIASVEEDDRQVLAGGLQQVLDVQRRIETDLASLDTIRTQLQALLQQGDSAAAQRRELYARAIDAFVRTATAELHLGDGLAAEDTVARFQQNVSSLVFAIQMRAYRDVLQNSLVLLQGMVPTDSTSCKPQSCNHFLRESVRLLSLATDISEAQSQDELRQAMSRFVSDGSTIDAKRREGPAAGVHLNAYPGIGVGWRKHASPAMLLRAPVGVEFVFRDVSRGRSGFALSVFTQIIDLGGFLPQDRDSVARPSDQLLAGVLTPGLFGMVTGRAWPLSFGVGATPSYVAVDGRWRSYPRVVAFVGMDLPILRFR
jgi:hypothetical protein